MTNFEKIKSKSIEEMSEFLMDWAVKFVTGKAPMNVKKWLESEVSDNGEENSQQ